MNLSRSRPSDGADWTPDALFLTAVSVLGTAIFLWGAVAVTTTRHPATMLTRAEAGAYLLISAIGTSSYLLRRHRLILEWFSTALRWLGWIHFAPTSLALSAVIAAAATNNSLPDSVIETASVGIATALVIAAAGASLRYTPRAQGE